MHNFPPHLSYVATLPENILATEQVRCFSLGGWLWKDHGCQNCKRKI